MFNERLGCIDPSSKGSYILVLSLSEDGDITVGKLGSRGFKAGYYAYAGSALGGLKARLSRHLRSEKKHHWHIDYLLDSAVIRDIIVFDNPSKLECDLAVMLGRSCDVIRGFGSSDCRCPGHLFYNDLYRTDTIMTLFRDANMHPVLIQDISERVGP